MNNITPYFTNLDRPVFGLKLPQEIAAMLFSRYSRSAKDLRTVFREEFLPLMSQYRYQYDASEEANRKTKDFFDRVLVGYGDDSVAQLCGAHVALEGVSQIAELFFTDARIGVSPLVKSTRYVRFDQKDEGGNYSYYTPKVLIDLAPHYNEVMNMLFDTYSQLVEPTQEWLRNQIPQGDSPLGAYNTSIRAKACDILRSFLPASALTNMGIFATGQAWEYLLTKGYSSNSEEITNLTSQTHEELKQLIPSLLKRAYRNEYLLHILHDMEKLSEDWEHSKPWNGGPVELRKWTSHAEWDVFAAIVEPLNKRIDPLYFGERERIDLFKTYIGDRKNRRDKPGRALEHASYTFYFCANLGIYRDLHRHRLLTQERQPISCLHGYDIPDEIIEMGYKSIFDECMEKAALLYDHVNTYGNSQIAEYCVPFAFRQRWYMKMNLREALHICELRSQPAGHPDYRKVVQSMWRQITQVHPSFGEIKNFVDFDDYSLGRLKSEVRNEQKRDLLCHGEQ